MMPPPATEEQAMQYKFMNYMMIFIGGASNQPNEVLERWYPMYYTSTEAEIDSAHVSSAYDIIHKLRPQFLISRGKLSLDTWAVLAAFLAALLIRAGVFKHFPW